MGGGASEGMRLWTVVGLLVVALLIVVISRKFRK
jgi:LPXTG-motif cell wall-anchored protein